MIYVCKVAHLQVVVVSKAVWGIFNNTTGLYLQVNTLLVIYKSRTIAYVYVMDGMFCMNATTRVLKSVLRYTVDKVR